MATRRRWPFRGREHFDHALKAVDGAPSASTDETGCFGGVKKKAQVLKRQVARSKVGNRRASQAPGAHHRRTASAEVHSLLTVDFRVVAVAVSPPAAGGQDDTQLERQACGHAL